MRRLLAGLLLGALLVASAPAVADHITEPQWTIDRLDMFVGHYSTGTRVECQDGQIGTWPSEFSRLRMNGYIVSSERQPNGNRPGGEPSEHFDVIQTIHYPWDVDRRKGALYMEDAWDHQNLPPHSAERWRVTRVDIGNMLDKPGFWRIFLQVDGRESGRTLTQECVFEVLPEE